MSGLLLLLFKLNGKKITINTDFATNCNKTKLKFQYTSPRLQIKFSHQ